MNNLPDQILNRFHELTPWNRFDEWSGICIETSTDFVCAFFGEDQEADFKLLILRGADPSDRYLQYRAGDWIPEFGLDFATTDGIKMSIVEDEVDTYFSCKPGQPPQALRLDEKQLMFEVLDAINALVKMMDEEKVPVLGETEDLCYHLWMIEKSSPGNAWRADVREFPDEQFVKHMPVEVSEARIKRIKAAGLLKEGVWEAAPFYLPVTRFQGNEEVFVQSAAIAERGAGLLGLVTLEAHANPEQEIVEALIGSIEKQMRIPQFLIVKDEQIAERVFPILQELGIEIRLRKRLRELVRIREEMIEEFPDDEDEDSEEE